MSYINVSIYDEYPSQHSLERAENMGYNKLSDFVFLLDKTFCENLKYKIRKDFYMDTLVNLFYQYGNISIITVAIINGIMFVLTFKSKQDVDKLLHPTSNRVRKTIPNINMTNEEIENAQKAYRRMSTLYSLYANITAIFPLLGILGTVAALIKEADDIEKLTDNFNVALSTTFFGILFAIFFKAIDAAISGSMEVIIEDISHVVQEYERKEAQE